LKLKASKAVQANFSESVRTSLITDLVEPIFEKLQKFNPGANYQRDDIKQTIRNILKSKRVEGVALMPD
jgi:translation elongation factor EF-G